MTSTYTHHELLTATRTFVEDYASAVAKGNMIEKADVLNSFVDRVAGWESDSYSRGYELGRSDGMAGSDSSAPDEAAEIADAAIGAPTLLTTHLSDNSPESFYPTLPADDQPTLTDAAYEQMAEDSKLPTGWHAVKDTVQ